MQSLRDMIAKQNNTHKIACLSPIRKSCLMNLKKKVKENIVPDAEKGKIFWSEIWDQQVKRNENSKWLKKMEQQEHVKIEVEKVKKYVSRIPNWKSPG